MTTGQRIKNARKAAGMTQAELASKLGIPFQSISQWERDLRNPKQETLDKIAIALNVSTFELRGYYTSEELFYLYMQGAQKWAMDFRFSEEQRSRVSEFLAESAAKLKALVNRMADAGQVDGKILTTPELQRALDDISHWTASALNYVNNDYTNDP